MLWDSTNGYPVVSDNNVFRQIIVEGGHAKFIRTTSQSAAVVKHGILDHLRRANQQIQN